MELKRHSAFPLMINADTLEYNDGLEYIDFIASNAPPMPQILQDIIWQGMKEASNTNVEAVIETFAKSQAEWSYAYANELIGLLVKNE